MKTQNPYTLETIKEYEEYSDEKITSILDQAEKSFPAWSSLSIHKRVKYLSQVANILEKEKIEIATLMTHEMGKPLEQAKSEVDKCVWVCRYYAENAESFLEDENLKSDHEKSYVTFQPLGTIFSIMPWNFPLWQVFRFIAPALAAGNVSILKHASNVTGVALKIEEIFKKADLPGGVFTTLVIGGKKASDLISSSKIQGLTFTGSTEVGREIGANAGKNLKKFVLELGGSDPYVILKDADLEIAAEKCITSRLINSGQSCIAAKRFIVEESVYEDFSELLLKELKKKTLGDPMNNPSVGPLAKKNLVEDLRKQKQDALDKGASLVYEQEANSDKGLFAPISFLKDCTKDMKVFQEETFGPLVALFKAKDEEDAIELANGNSFGLGGAIFSKDLEKAERIAKEKIITGTCAVNDFVKSDPRLPFGGTKESGIGRELSSYGIREFVNIKTVTVD